MDDYNIVWGGIENFVSPKQCETMAEHEITEQQGGQPVKGNLRTSIHLKKMEMIKHAVTKV